MSNINNLKGFDDNFIRTDTLNKCCFQFTQKHVYSTKNNPMCGVTVPQWYSILSNNYKYVELKYYPRLAFITMMSIINTILSAIESFYNHKDILSHEPLIRGPHCCGGYRIHL